LNLAPAPVIKLNDAREVRSLCVMMVIEAVVSYRSVPRILDLFKVHTALQWVPHFTSVINWTLRLGIGLLKQVSKIDTPWLAIVDHSIDIGTKKAMVVLRVTADALSKRGGAICLKDCECIGLHISETVNGESVSLQLETTFNQAGKPIGIIRDGDATLAKGVRLWSEKKKIPVISDLGHAMAIALKDEFEKSANFKLFTKLTSQVAKRLRQTDLAFLIPPKLRSKGRFQSISKLAKWGERMIEVLSVKGRPPKGSLLDRLRKVMPGYTKLKPFITEFSSTTKLLSEVLAILKNKGLSQITYDQCFKLSEDLPKNSVVRTKLQNWLKVHIEIQVTNFPLLVSSDIIESLFGNFKHIIERSPQADMNRTTLLIPTLCGNLDEMTITRALNQTCHKDLQIWEEENIPYTVRKKRNEFFNKIKSQKAGEKAA